MVSKEAEVLLAFELGTQQVDRLMTRFPQVNFHYAPCHSQDELMTLLGAARHSLWLYAS